MRSGYVIVPKCTLCKSNKASFTYNCIFPLMLMPSRTVCISSEKHCQWLRILWYCSFCRTTKLKIAWPAQMRRLARVVDAHTCIYKEETNMRVWSIFYEISTISIAAYVCLQNHYSYSLIIKIYYGLTHVLLLVAYMYDNGYNINRYNNASSYEIIQRKAPGASQAYRTMVFLIE